MLFKNEDKKYREALEKVCMELAVELVHATRDVGASVGFKHPKNKQNAVNEEARALIDEKLKRIMK